MASQTLLLTSPLHSTPLFHHSSPLQSKPQSILPSLRHSRLSAVKSPRGFGPPPPSPKKKSKRRQQKYEAEEEEEEEEEDDEDRIIGDDDYDPDITIPEVVTNRMIKRMGLSVGIPMATGLLFFPFFYYLKVFVKIDVPTFVPLLVSFFFFGTALLGVSYGIVSASWDPLREGSLLGWNEATRNWPVYWDSLWGGNDRSTRGGGSKRPR